jgi:phosphoribosylanthranilate isomerase
MMGRLKIKICGMREPQNVEAVGAQAIDFMGFIFYPHSPRFVGNDFKMPPLPKQVKRVGVFVNEHPDVVFNHAKNHSLDLVQLHGSETADEVKQLSLRDIRVIKAIGVNEQTEFTGLSSFVPYIDYFLFDTKSIMYGGTGKLFDWSVLSKYALPVPFLLSGGIGEEQVKSIQQFQHPKFVGVDLNSKVELSAGVKNPETIERIIQTLNTNK